MDEGSASDGSAPESAGADLLDQLTAKQREVLDLLIEHKTSKEISRQLGISPHTVDQRILFARAKLNVSTRGEVAHAYRRLLAERGLLPHVDGTQAIYGQSIYGSSHIAEAGFAGQEDWQEDPVVPGVATGLEQVGRLGQRQMTRVEAAALAEPYHRVLPEMFDGPNGTLLRLGAIALIAVFLILIVMGSLAMFAQLSHMVDH